jgi:hypothetical protein
VAVAEVAVNVPFLDITAVLVAVVRPMVRVMVEQVYQHLVLMEAMEMAAVQQVVAEVLVLRVPHLMVALDLLIPQQARQ